MFSTQNLNCYLKHAFITRIYRQDACRTHLPDTLTSRRLENIYTTVTEIISTKQNATSLRTIYIILLSCRRSINS